MFSIFKSDPIKKLQKKQDLLLTRAVDAQRNGKIELYSQLHFEADQINTQIEELKKNQADKD